MYMDALRSIDGIGIFPVLSLVLFVTVFTVMLIRTARLDRSQLADYSRLPFDDAEPGPMDAISDERD